MIRQFSAAGIFYILKFLLFRGIGFACLPIFPIPVRRKGVRASKWEQNLKMFIYKSYITDLFAELCFNILLKPLDTNSVLHFI